MHTETSETSVARKNDQWIQGIAEHETTQYLTNLNAFVGLCSNICGYFPNWLFLLPKSDKHALSKIRDQRVPEWLAVLMTEILHGNCSLPGNVWSSRLLEIYE